jgi:hypothetical protein
MNSGPSHPPYSLDTVLLPEFVTHMFAPSKATPQGLAPTLNVSNAVSPVTSGQAFRMSGRKRIRPEIQNLETKV